MRRLCFQEATFEHRSVFAALISFRFNRWAISIEVLAIPESQLAKHEEVEESGSNHAQVPLEPVSCLCYGPHVEVKRSTRRRGFVMKTHRRFGTDWNSQTLSKNVFKYINTHDSDRCDSCSNKVFDDVRPMTTLNTLKLHKLYK